MKTQIEQTQDMPIPSHTALPWHLSKRAPGFAAVPAIVSESGLHITDISGYGMTVAQDSANAALICRAVNSHGALISALRVIGTQAIDFTWTAEQAFLFMRQTARAALETATKGSK